MPTLFLKPGRVYVALREEDLDLAEEGWEPVAKFRNLSLALRAAQWYVEKFEYILEWG